MEPLSDNEKLLLRAAIHTNMKTDNPRVNYFVDQHFEDEYHEYDEPLYIDEITSWEKTGGVLLSLIEN